jgi:hypothetical protein
MGLFEEVGDPRFELRLKLSELESVTLKVRGFFSIRS